MNWKDDWQKELVKRTGDDGYATFSPDNPEDMEFVDRIMDEIVAEQRKFDNFLKKYGNINVADVLLHPERFNFTEEEQ